MSTLLEPSFLKKPILKEITSTQNTPSTCLHCGASLSASQEKYCCMGCETAHHMVNSVLHTTKNALLLSPLAEKTNQNSTQGYELSVAISGVHCASCIQLIEHSLKQQHDIIDARVNMSTGRLYLHWKGMPERADAYGYLVQNIGYKITPLKQNTLTKSPEEKNLLYALAVSAFGSANMMLISVVLWSSGDAEMGTATRDLFHWISALIALPIVIYSGQPFFRSAWAVLKQKRTNMDVPISLGVIGACLMSLFETLNHGKHAYFDSAVMLIFFLLIGRYFDLKAKGKARALAEELLQKLQGYATIIDNGLLKTIPMHDVEPNMIVSVASGENIPADGLILSGQTEIDTSMMTGETLPRFAGIGDQVFAGTTNLMGHITLKVSQKNTNTLLSQIVRLMEKAEQNNSYYVRLADKAAQLYTPVVHLLGLLTFIGWLALGMPWQTALLIAITVLIITCPCALGLAVPVVQIIASSLLMKKGILLKSGDALERLAMVDTVIFDKTGTLTLGNPVLKPHDIPEDLLPKVVSLASQSKHPLSKAICGAYPDVVLLPVTDFTEQAGKGISGMVAGDKIMLGNASWCEAHERNQQSNHPDLSLWVKVAHDLYHVRFADNLRPDSEGVMAYFKKKNIQTILLSGDRKKVVQHTASMLGIASFYAEFSPTDKADFVQQLKGQGHKILMIGDGLNDAAALAGSDISISPATALDIVQNTADIVFQLASLDSVRESHQIAVTAQSLVKSNFLLAVIYNIIAVPFAMAGYVTPMIAAIAMSSSSLLVIGNSFRLHLGKRT